MAASPITAVGLNLQDMVMEMHHKLRVPGVKVLIYSTALFCTAVSHP
jgi:hypothetical protein